LSDNRIYANDLNDEGFEAEDFLAVQMAMNTSPVKKRKKKTEPSVLAIEANEATQGEAGAAATSLYP
jgi:hypothetical protein